VRLGFLVGVVKPVRCHVQMELASHNARICAIIMAGAWCPTAVFLHACAMKDLLVIHAMYLFAQTIVAEMGFV
jgi:hypothetical protein